ncbi:MAG: IS200/IS605 family transposase [Pyrinomonadaceae bacterium]
MPSSYTCLNVHLVFSIKDRMPLIRAEWRERLYSYLGGIVKGLNAAPVAIGGVSDHVHLLVGLRATHRLDYFIRELKSSSSEWVHAELEKKFEWQKGYGAFSVSPTAMDQVKHYVLNQEAHHQRFTFKEEYSELLKLSGVEYDERYLW